MASSLGIGGGGSAEIRDDGVARLAHGSRQSSCRNVEACRRFQERIELDVTKVCVDLAREIQIARARRPLRAAAGGEGRQPECEQTYSNSIHACHLRRVGKQAQVMHLAPTGTHRELRSWLFWEPVRRHHYDLRIRDIDVTHKLIHQRKLTSHAA